MGGAFTMEGWVLPSLDGYGLFGVGEAFFTTDASHQLRLWAPETGQYTILSSGYSAGTWVHVAYVRDAQGLVWRTYLNGVLATSGTFATPTSYGSSLSGLTIGAYAIGASYTANGCPLDDLIVTAAVKYTTDFTPRARGNAFDASGPSGVVLLLHGDGANGSTTFTDSSTYGHTVTASGSEASISTAQSKFGGASIHITHAAVMSDLTVGPHDALAMGTGDFTAEAWVYVDVGVNILPSETSIFGDFLWSSGYQGGWVVEVIVDGSVMLRYNGSLYGYSILSTEPGLVAGNTWCHIATSREAGVQRLFVDGVLRATVANTKDYTPGRPFVVGSRRSDGVSVTLLNGYIDDLRVTKGVALYTGNFTPPTAALSTTLPGAPTAVNGAQYVTLADFTSVGTGAQQAFAPDAYGTSSVTLAGFTVAHSVTVNGNSTNGVGTADVLAGMTCSGAGVADRRLHSGRPGEYRQRGGEHTNRSHDSHNPRRCVPVGIRADARTIRGHRRRRTGCSFRVRVHGRDDNATYSAGRGRDAGAGSLFDRFS